MTVIFVPIFYKVDSNSFFEVKCYKPKKNVGLIRKINKALKNQV